MATRKNSRKAVSSGNGSSQGRLLDTVHQIYLAGLGAVSKAQRGTPKLLDDLISEGARVHADTRGAAEKALRGVLGEVQSTINARVSQAKGQASDAFENLEKIFQTRVHRALTQLGVPSAEEIETLSRRVDSLNSNIEKLANARKPVSKPKPASRSRAHAARRSGHASTNAS